MGIDSCLPARCESRLAVITELGPPSVTFVSSHPLAGRTCQGKLNQDADLRAAKAIQADVGNCQNVAGSIALYSTNHMEILLDEALAQGNLRASPRPRSHRAAVRYVYVPPPAAPRGPHQVNPHPPPAPRRGVTRSGGGFTAAASTRRRAGAELGSQAVEHSGVGAARVGAGCPRRGQERVGCPGEGDGAAPDRGHGRARPLACHAASAVPLVMYRITCASRAGAAGPGRLPSRGRAALVYRITAHYPVAVPGWPWPPGIDGRRGRGPGASGLGRPGRRGMRRVECQPGAEAGDRLRFRRLLALRAVWRDDAG
jgi:hypothetical protein